MIWSLIVFMTAFFAAYQVDFIQNKKHSKLTRIGIRGGIVLLQGTLTVWAVYFAFMHVYGSGSFEIDSLHEIAQSKLVVYSLIRFLLGVSLNLAFGFCRLEQRRESGRWAYHDAPG